MASSEIPRSPGGISSTSTVPPAGTVASSTARVASSRLTSTSAPSTSTGPEKAPALRITIGLRNAPDSWRDYLYWNVSLDDS